MQIPQKFPQFLDSEALVIVAGKTVGKIYRIKDGEFNTVETLEKPIESLTDDEGFFFAGVRGTGGAPKDRSNEEEEHIKQLRKNIAAELDNLIKQESAKVLYIFEPEHLKGRIEETLQRHPHLTIHTVAYGNYVGEAPMDLLEQINTYIQEHTVDTEVDFATDQEKYS